MYVCAQRYSVRRRHVCVIVCDDLRLAETNRLKFNDGRRGLIL